MPSLNLVVIRVADLERAHRFYQALGLQLKPERHNSGPEHFSANLGGITFEIYPLGSKRPSTGIRLGFSVISVDDAIAAIQQAGGKLESPPINSEWGYSSVVSDPDGHRIEIVQQSQARDPRSPAM